MNSVKTFQIAGRGSTIRIFCVILILLAFTFSSALAQTGAWLKRTSMPTVKVGAAACVVGDKIYVMGGYSTESGDLSTNEMYDPLTDTWQAKKNMPTARGFLSLAVVDGIIYAIGGGFPTATAVVEAYDPASDSWTLKKNLLSARSGAQAAVANGIIYNIGGNLDQSNCEAYNPRTYTWVNKTSMPGPGGNVAVTECDGLIYVLGGGRNAAFNTVYVYDPMTDTWSRKRDMPTARFGFQAHLVDGRIYAIGGSPRQGISLSTVEVYDPSTDTWNTKANMQEKSVYFAGAVARGSIYTFGGSPDWVSGGINVWKFNPAYHTDVAAGEVSGTWTWLNSPYRVNGEITIPNGQQLAIEPGVEVDFMGHYKLNVQGRIVAVGTADQPIVFTADNPPTGWHGIRFVETAASNDTSKILYSTFRYGKANTGGWLSLDRCGGAMLIAGFDKVIVAASRFEQNMTNGDALNTGGAAICILGGSPTITGNTFLNNESSAGGVIRIDYASEAVVSKNTISQNSTHSGAIVCAFGWVANAPTISENMITNNFNPYGAGGIRVATSSPRILNNVIAYNEGGSGGGIFCYSEGNAVIINNTIFQNNAEVGGGLHSMFNSDPVLINNILYANSAARGNEVFIEDTLSDPAFHYCDVRGGKEGFEGGGAGANYTGVYANNIDADPILVNPTYGAFGLKYTSPCIAAGVESVATGGTTYLCPSFCIMGNPRPNPPGSKPDIGACESQWGSANMATTRVEGRSSIPAAFALGQNYPNPFNPTTVISSQLTAPGRVRLAVYDMLGREVAVLVNEWREAGSYRDTFDAKGLASGTYVYRLRAGSYVECRKMVLMK